MKQLTTLVLCLFTFFTVAAQAGPQTKDYQNLKADESFKMYLIGIADGFLVANTTGKEPLFCQPPKLYLNAEAYAGILDSYMAQVTIPKHLQDGPLALHILYSLQRAFPCKK